MASPKSRKVKNEQQEKFLALAKTYSSAAIISIDNIGSHQLQHLRKTLRGKGEMIKSKNTVIRRALRASAKENPTFDLLAQTINGNCAVVFTNSPLKEVCREVNENKVRAAAKPGVIAPNDVVVPSGPTPMPPAMTNFFQTLNIPTRIAKDRIEIVSDIDLIRQGDKVGRSEVELLRKLNIKPFLFGPKLVTIFDNGKLFSPEIFLMQKDQLLQMFGQAASIVAAIGVAAEVPNTASVAHSLRHSMRLLLAASFESGFTFKEAEEAKSRMATSAAEVPSEEPKEEEAKEEEVEEDMGAGLGDLFGESDEESDE